MAEKNQVNELRQKVLDTIKQLPKDTVEDIDVERWEKDDKWVENFLRHRKMNFDDAFKMAMETLKWRRQTKINYLTAEKIPKSIQEPCGIFIANTDKDGRKILVLQIKKHKKDSAMQAHQRNFILYWVEKIEKESNGEQITIILDMNGAGVKNMDMEFQKFFLNLFDAYYPNFVAHILLFDLPWILNAFWKLIKAWISNSLDEITIPVTKTTIKEYVADDQLVIGMGGKSTFEPTWDGIGAD